ncbi:MAG: S-adenosylmethionine:tRNA ribosyltransferase-isomerase [Pirellulaceae bacterium]
MLESTFRPVKAEVLDEHTMHSEWGTVDSRAIEQIESCHNRSGRVIAVGTTTTRILETAARNLPLAPWTGSTDIFIRPGFDFHCLDGLITNFHFPRSTLLVLVRTFGGDELMREAYRKAIEQKYRFFSYGDAMLII